MTVEINVRPFDPADAVALRELTAQSIEYLTREFYTEEQRLAWVCAAVEDAEEFVERLWAGDTFVAEVDSVQAGYATLKDGNVIDLLYVHPHHARQGVARAILNAVEELARAHGVNTLTAESSDAARAFFEKQGYAPTQRNSVVLDEEWLTNMTMSKTLSDTSVSGTA